MSEGPLLDRERDALTPRGGRSSLRVSADGGAGRPSVAVLPPRRQPPLVEFVPQPCRGVPAQGHSDDEDEVGSPGVVMAFAAVPALERLTRFPSRVKVGSDDVR